MSKSESLELLKLLSALESWSFANGSQLPDYLHDRLQEAIDRLTEQVLISEGARN